jgi:zinc transport system substrate-binding protein
MHSGIVASIMRAIIILISVTVAISACAPRSPGGDGVAVVAGFYPLAEAAERIGGSCVNVTNITPAGVEPHDLELAPDDVAAVVEADVVIVLGGFQPALDDAASQAEGIVVDVGQLASGSGVVSDPHLWLDPGAWAAAMPTIEGVLAKAGCDADSTTYERELALLDEEFAAGLAGCDRNLIVTAHAAFGHLASAYGIAHEAIAGLDPAAEPTADRIAQLHDLVEREGVTTIFAEELVAPDVAMTLADEAGVAVAILDPLEGLTPDKAAAGEDYASIMRANLETLRGALGCP